MATHRRLTTVPGVITKLPRWIWPGAWLLAVAAGVVNAVGFLSFNHQAITHLTGTTTLLASAAARRDVPEILHLAAALGAFVLGCALSGFIVRDTALQLGRRYGIALLLESALLIGSIPLLERQQAAGLYAAACACGLQNAMMSTFSGAVVRTSHVSGMFTDLGVFVGHALRGLPLDWRRFRLCLLVISGFFAGGVVGTWGFMSVGYRILGLPAGLAATMAVAYGIHEMRTRNAP